jgi:hypothetical protein
MKKSARKIIVEKPRERISSPNSAKSTIHGDDWDNSDKIHGNSRLPLRNGFSPRNAVFVGLLALLAFTIGYFASFGFKGYVSLAESQFRKFRADTIVADADIRNSAISPNGKYLALVQVKNGVQSLHLRQIETATASRSFRKSTENYRRGFFT